jgi:hypothetical protein
VVRVGVFESEREQIVGRVRAIHPDDDGRTLLRQSGWPAQRNHGRFAVSSDRAGDRT